MDMNKIQQKGKTTFYFSYEDAKKLTGWALFIAIMLVITGVGALPIGAISIFCGIKLYNVVSDIKSVIATKNIAFSITAGEALASHFKMMYIYIIIGIVLIIVAILIIIVMTIFIGYMMTMNPDFQYPNNFEDFLPGFGGTSGL